MADDMKMPSEDEDFDAVHTGEPILSDFDDKPEQPAEKPAGTSVKIITDDDEPQSDEPENEQSETSESEASETSDTEPDTSEPEQATDFEAPAETESTDPESSNEETPTEQPADESNDVSEDQPMEPESSSQSETEAPSDPVAAETEPLPAVSEQLPKPAKEKKVRQPGSGLSFHFLIEALLILAVVGLGLWGSQLAHDKKDLQKQLKVANANPQTIIQKQTDTLISKVSKLIQLPAGETPTIANVTDADQARKQSAFFKDAQNGDKVLMYVKAGEAILYRPSTNKIVLVAPLTFSDSASTTSTGTTGASTTTPVKH